MALMLQLQSLHICPLASVFRDLPREPRQGYECSSHGLSSCPPFPWPFPPCEATKPKTDWALLGLAWPQATSLLLFILFRGGQGEPAKGMGWVWLIGRYSLALPTFSVAWESPLLSPHSVSLSASADCNRADRGWGGDMKTQPRAHLGQMEGTGAITWQG